MVCKVQINFLFNGGTYETQFGIKSQLNKKLCILNSKELTLLIIKIILLLIIRKEEFHKAFAWKTVSVEGIGTVTWAVITILFFTEHSTVDVNIITE